MATLLLWREIMKLTFLKRLLKNAVKEICDREQLHISRRGTKDSRQTSSVSRDWHVYSNTTACSEVTDLTEEEAKDICADLNLCDHGYDWKYAEDKPENGEIGEA